MYFAVFATDRVDASQTRSDLTDGFRDYLHDRRDHSDVVLHHGGQTLAADGETTVGSLLIVEAPSLKAVEDFVADSPYAKADVYADVQIRQWNWLTGRPE